MLEAITNTEQVEVLIQRLPGHDDIVLPAYHSEDAAGMDVCAACPDGEPVTIDPGRIALIPCGFAMALPVGYEAQIRPRSGLASKHGICIPNSPGTIDADYRGEVKIALIHHGQEPFMITRGMRVAQMIIKPVPRTKWIVVSELPGSLRGEGGFGHTGQ